VGLSSFIEPTKSGAGFHIRAPFAGIDADLSHPGEVNHQAVLGHGISGNVVPRASYRDFEAVLARERDCVSNIACCRALHDCSRTPIDHRIPDLASFVITRIPRNKHLARNILSQPFSFLISSSFHPYAPSKESNLSLVRLNLESARESLDGTWIFLNFGGPSRSAIRLE
jgi:hypothetical protein